MNDGVSSILDPVKRPEYIGSNRCRPCTVVNVVLAAVASGAVGAATSVGVGVVVLAVCVAAIYLRGYLIPGTPTLTKRYMPDRIHRLFGTHHVDGAGHADADVASGDAEPAGPYASAREALLAEGVVVDPADGDDLLLDPSFRDAWRARIDGLRKSDTGVERLAAHIDVDPDLLALEDRSREYAVTYEGKRIDGWPSRAAFLADMGVEPTLSEWCSDWESYDPERRTQIIASLRAFLERCPACEADLEASESAWETCCREGTDVTVACNACGDVVFSGRY